MINHPLAFVILAAAGIACLAISWLAYHAEGDQALAPSVVLAGMGILLLGISGGALAIEFARWVSP